MLVISAMQEHEKYNKLKDLEKLLSQRLKQQAKQKDTPESDQDLRNFCVQ
jgi:hypothetical protein